MREAAFWSLVWVGAAAAFCAWLWWHLTGLHGREVADEKALEFITGYLIEKSLAVTASWVWPKTGYARAGKEPEESR